MTLLDLKNNLNLTYKEMALQCGLPLATIYKLANDKMYLKNEYLVNKYKEIFFNSFGVYIDFKISEFANDNINNLKLTIADLQKENKSLKKTITNIYNHLSALEFAFDDIDELNKFTKLINDIYRFKNLILDIKNIDKTIKYKKRYIRRRRLSIENKSNND